MSDIGIFDVLGPIMIGPSSSHTAGAAKLGKIAKTIVKKPIKHVQFFLHGSFRETYKGHGTDRALTAGILGMLPNNSNLKDAISIAESKGISLEFIPCDLGDVHPNTVKFVITDCDNDKWEIQGSSIGGGLIEINEINKTTVKITGQYPTIITFHNDIPGTVSKISTLLFDSKVNIAAMALIRKQRGKDATMTVEIDDVVSDSIIDKIKHISGVNHVIFINPKGDECENGHS